jgi:O-antigen/teichoic acid export membrane protein
VGEIKKQSINNTWLSYLGAGLGFIIIYVQPHLISAADIGLTRLILSFGWLSAISMPLGMGNVTMRFFPKIKNNENGNNGYFGILILVCTIGALTIGTILFLYKGFFINYYKKSDEFSNFFSEAIVFAYVLSLISLLTTYCAILLKTTITVFLTDVFIRIGQFTLVILYHCELFNRYTFVMLYMSLFLLQLVVMIFYLISIKAVSLKINWQFYKTLPLKKIALFALLMMFTSLASLGIKFLDQLMIGHFLNETYVGIYATCVMMSVVMEIPFNSLERIAQPKIAYAWDINDKAEVLKIYELSSRYMFFVGGLLFCLLWASTDAIFMFLPAEYSLGKTAFYIVSVASLINLLTGVNSSVILSSNKYFAASLFLFLMIVISYVANNLLIKQMGISGAALSTLIALGTFNVLKYFYILAKFKMQPFTKHTFYVTECIIVSIIFITCLPSGLHPILRALIGGSFTAGVFLLMNLKQNSIHEINKVFKRIKLLK